MDVAGAEGRSVEVVAVPRQHRKLFAALCAVETKRMKNEKVKKGCAATETGEHQEKSGAEASL